MPDYYDALRKLAIRLQYATNEGRITWQPNTDHAFVYSTPNSNAEIRSVDDDGVSPFELSVFDQDGSVVDAVDTKEAPGDLASMLEDLYHAARRNALGTDKIVRDLLETLPVPPEENPY